MKENIYKKTSWISDKIPLNGYKKITGQRRIFPFYHSVVEEIPIHLKHLNYNRKLADFEKDIYFFTRHYSSFSTEEINTKSEGFHLSFDDGLKEVYEKALPILNKKSIKTTIFVNSDFVDNRDMFYRYKMSLLVEEINNSEKAMDIVCGFLGVEKSAAVGELKKIHQAQEIEQMVNLVSLDIESYLHDVRPYLSTSQLIELEQKGHTIANHSAHHYPMNLLTFDLQKQEIIKTTRFLEQNFKSKMRLFSFPFGDTQIKNELFDWLYHQENYFYSFGVSGMKKDDHQQHIHRISMEYDGFSAEQILKFEYFYFVLKSFLGKNRVKR